MFQKPTAPLRRGSSSRRWWPRCLLILCSTCSTACFAQSLPDSLKLRPYRLTDNQARQAILAKLEADNLRREVAQLRAAVRTADSLRTELTARNAYLESGAQQDSQLIERLNRQLRHQRRELWLWRAKGLGDLIRHTHDLLTR